MICSECRAEQPAGSLFCAECGGALHTGTLSPKTDILPFSQDEQSQRPLSRINQERIKPADNDLSLELVIPASRQRLTLSIAGSARIGRSDPRSNHFPELDLTEHKGGESGVSRFHAILKHTTEGLLVVDQNSTNGTSINGQRLLPEEHYLLQHGDELRIGDLLIHLLIKSST